MAIGIALHCLDEIAIDQRAGWMRRNRRRIRFPVRAGCLDEVLAAGVPHRGVLLFSEETDDILQPYQASRRAAAPTVGAWRHACHAAELSRRQACARVVRGGKFFLRTGLSR